MLWNDIYKRFAEGPVGKQIVPSRGRCDAAESHRPLNSVYSKGRPLRARANCWLSRWSGLSETAIL